MHGRERRLFSIALEIGPQQASCEWRRKADIRSNRIQNSNYASLPWADTPFTADRSIA